MAENLNSCYRMERIKVGIYIDTRSFHSSISYQKVVILYEGLSSLLLWMRYITYELFVRISSIQQYYREIDKLIASWETFTKLICQLNEEMF